MDGHDATPLQTAERVGDVELVIARTLNNVFVLGSDENYQVLRTSDLGVVIEKASGPLSPNGELVVDYEQRWDADQPYLHIHETATGCPRQPMYSCN